MKEVKPRKPYRSPSRAEQLDATRRAILAAARKLFGERGYPGTTIEAIAAESGMAAPTVYKNFGNKRQLLLALIEQTINLRVPRLQAEVEAEAAPRARIEALARMCVELASEAADVVTTLVSAAGVDPEFRAKLAEMAESRRRNAGGVARQLAREGALRPGYSEAEARDILYTMAGPETYELLVTRSGWTNQQFEAWLSDSLASQLIDELK